ncbi:GW dipeptide domain-containing protein [Yeosuana sp.]|uniref:GW dipeptide domain-containing protein n=1 Tax=Yeosuana sp. TaxID=2529388 RepID=UPI0040552591
MKLLLVFIFSLITLTSCNDKNKKHKTANSDPASHHVKVKEVLQTDTYTYLFVNENDEDYWMATGKMEPKVNSDLYYKNAFEMIDFKSKELNRTFDKVLLVDNISDKPILATSSLVNDSIHKGINNQVLKDDIHVERAPGGITIAELYKNGNDYANKKIVVRGQVVKINNSIMDRNWVHLKDGTNNEGKSDLTFTTKDDVKMGDIVTFEGTVSLNKDYGAGYVYPLIVENATIK